MRTDEVADLIRDVCERVILPRFGALASHEVIQKRPGDVVTVADREAEAELTAAFGRATPGALVVGEEASFADPTALRAPAIHQRLQINFTLERPIQRNRRGLLHAVGQPRH